MEIKLANYDSYSYQYVKEQEGRGGRFVTYRWIIPLPLFMPITRLSKVFFIDKDCKASRYCGRFNVANLLLGWWGLPFGPPQLINSVITNLRGGVDVTEDIYLNLSEKQYENGRIMLEKRAVQFMHPDKAEIKAFKKSALALIKDGILTKMPVVAFFIDTEKNEKPFLVMGIYDIANEHSRQAIYKELYKRFLSNTRIDIIDVTDDTELNKRLIRQAYQFEN